MNSNLSIKEVFSIILPLLLLITFIKSFFSSIFLFYLGDIIFAFTIAVLTFRNSGILLYVFLFLMGLLRGLEFLNVEIISGVYFVFLGITWNYSKKYLAFERLESKISVWVLSILFFQIFRLIFYFYNLNTFIDWMLILSLVIKSFCYFFLTFFWVWVFYKILNSFFVKNYEKI